jgi:hypothetical protein
MNSFMRFANPATSVMSNIELRIRRSKQCAKSGERVSGRHADKHLRKLQ